MFSGKWLFTLIKQLKHRVNLCSHHVFIIRQNFCPTWSNLTKRVKAVLQDNNYPSSFINSHKILLPKLPTNLPFNSFVVLPFVQGILERISQGNNKSKSPSTHWKLRTVCSCNQSPGKGWLARIWNSEINHLHQLQWPWLQDLWPCPQKQPRNRFC